MARAFLIISILFAISVVTVAAEPGKPVAAVFPMGGDASESLRSRCAYAMRAKLDRDGVYRVVDGYAMADLAAEAAGGIDFDTPPAVVRELAGLRDATVAIWGELKQEGDSQRLRIKLLDLSEPGAVPREMIKTIQRPQELRFAVEEILETLPGIERFEHPTDEAVQRDPRAEELWETNPNLVRNSDFSQHGLWDGILREQKYPVQISDRLPEVDRIGIYRMPADDGAEHNNVLVMNMSRGVAETNGLACLSAEIPIEPDTRYRLSFRYRSDGPVAIVFVKGYTTAENIRGESAEREVYKRQLPRAGRTDGQWITVEADLNPQHVAFAVEHLRINFYVYLHPGTAMFDDVVLKAVGEQTRTARDAALKPPVPTRDRR